MRSGVLSPNMLLKLSGQEGVRILDLEEKEPGAARNQIK